MINFNNLAGSPTQSPIVRETARTGSTSGAARHPGEEARTPEVHVRGTDSVDFSELARRLSERRASQPVRQDLVDRIRAEIESGGYESGDKLDVATNRLLRDLDILG